jgi:RNA polymerase sigma-70 factor, ECF subfamily
MSYSLTKSLKSTAKTKGLSEEEIVSYLEQSEPMIIEYIYDNYSSALYGIVVKILRGRDDLAEDVLQESFTKIWLGRTQYNSTKGTLFTWMLNIARNTAIDKFRSSDFRDSSLTNTPMNQSTSESVDITMESFETGESPSYFETVDMPEILAKLPNEQRQIIDLMYFQGYTQSEIADEFGIPLGTVKSRARLAIEGLRVIYAHVSVDNQSSDSLLNGALLLAIIEVVQTISQESTYQIL